MKLFVALLSLTPATLLAQVPSLISYQGRVAVGTTNFEGTGQFRFALVNTTGTTTYWSNDGTSSAGSQPVAAVSLTVTKGLYSVLLGDTALTNMTAMPTSVFANADVRLRVWFNDGVNGSQLLTPDQRLAPNGYLPDGAASSAKIADAAITGPKLADGAITSAKIVAGTVVTSVTVAGIAQTAVANTSYTATNASLTTFTLPTSASVGDVVKVTGVGNGGWSVVPGAAQGITAPWVPRESNRTWHSVASSSDGAKLAAVVNGGQIYTSTDSGVNWLPRESNRAWYWVASSSDGAKLAAVVNGGQIYTSTDSGVNWVPRESNRFWTSVASSSDGSKLVAVVNGGQIYTSTDFGVNWFPHESSRSWSSVTSSSDGTKLVALVYGVQIYTSTDSGAIWTPRESNRNWISVASSSDGSKLVAAVDGGQIYTSTDSGVSWTPRVIGGPSFRVASSSDGSKLVVVTFGGQIYTSTDSGVNWIAQESFRFWRSVACSSDGAKLVATVGSGQIYTSDRSLIGSSGEVAAVVYRGNGLWQAVSDAALPPGSITGRELADGGITAAKIAAGTVVTSVTVAGIAQTAVANTSYTATNASLTTFTLPTSASVGDVVKVTGVGNGGWSVVPGAAQGITAPWVPRESNRTWQSGASSSDGTKLVAVVYGGQIYTSTDSGVNWTPRESSRSWSSVATSSDGSKLAALEYPGQIYISTDFGVSWTPRESARFWTSVASSSDGSKLVAVVSGGQIYTSTDSGVNWLPRESNRTWRSVASSSDGTKLVAVVSGGQIYTSTDSGVNWLPRQNNRQWTSVAASSDSTKLVAVVYGGQIYTSTDSGVNWLPRESSRNWFSVASSSDGAKLVALVQGGQIYTSTDSGVNWVPRESSRNWFSVAASSDGTKLVALVYGGQIYTSDRSLTGSGGEAAAVVYHGNGLWQAVNDAVLPPGSVTEAQLEPAFSARLPRLDATQTFTGANTFNHAGNSFTGSGAGLGSLNASNVSSGTLSDARLSSNVALRGSANSFTGTQTFNVDATKTLQIRFDTGLVPGINLTGTGGNLGVLRLRNSLEVWPSDDATRAGRIDLRNTSGTATLVLDGSDGEIITSGRVGVGRTAAANKLEVEGEASKTAAGSWLANSDRRIKADINPVAGALATLDRVQLVDFRYTEAYRAAHPGIEDRRYLNVVAQEFAEVFPDHVKRSGEKMPDGSDMLQVDTHPLTIYSAAAVQELHAMLKAKGDEISELKSRLEKLEALIRNTGAK